MPELRQIKWLLVLGLVLALAVIAVPMAAKEIHKSSAKGSCVPNADETYHCK